MGASESAIDTELAVATNAKIGKIRAFIGNSIKQFLRQLYLLK